MKHVDDFLEAYDTLKPSEKMEAGSRLALAVTLIKQLRRSAPAPLPAPASAPPEEPGIIEDLLAYGNEQEIAALKHKDSSDFKFWTGWNTALQRVKSAPAPLTAPQEGKITDFCNIACVPSRHYAPCPQAPKDARAQADDLAVEFLQKFPSASADRNHLGAWFHSAMQIGAEMVRPELVAPLPAPTRWTGPMAGFAPRTEKLFLTNTTNSGDTGGPHEGDK